MKRSAKVTPFVLAWAMSSVVGPQAAAQTQPANPGTPPAAVETPQPTPAPAQQQKQRSNRRWQSSYALRRCRRDEWLRFCEQRH